MNDTQVILDASPEDLAAARFDFWDFDLWKVAGGPEAADAAMIEIEARENAAHREFFESSIFDLVPDELLDDSYPLGEINWDAKYDRYHPDLDGYPLRDKALNTVIEQLDFFETLERINCWFKRAGEPYQLPTFVTGEAARATKLSIRPIISILKTERQIHEIKGHSVVPSIYCEVCVPDPALAVWTLAAMPVQDLRGLATTGAKVLEKLQEHVEARKYALPLLELVTQSHQPVPMLEGIVPAEGVGIIAAPPGAGKTGLAVRIAVGVASERKRVLYLNAEGNSHIGARVEAEALRRGVPIQTIANRMTVGIKVPNLFEPDSVYANTLEVSRRERPDVIVIDTLALASGDARQEDAGHMSRIVQNARALGDAAGAVVILLAHTGKVVKRGIRGSNAVEASADWILGVHRSRQKVTATVDKMRDGRGGQTVRYRQRELGQSYVLDLVEPAEPEDGHETDSPEAEESKAFDIPTRIREALNGAYLSLSTAQVHATVNEDGDEDLGLSTVRRHLKSLVEAGEVEASGERNARVYSLVEGLK